MRNFIKTYFEGIIAVMYPHTCLSCGQPLVKGEEYACSECMYQVRRTDYHLQKENPVAQLFYGRIDLVFATSYFGFDKGGIFQKLIHQLKYQNQKEVGEMLGQHMGMGLKNSPFLPAVDAIIPVPLHKKKAKKRGYNQSEHIAIGLASVMKTKVDTSTLLRISYSGSQTKLSREKRWDNVAESFALSDKETLKGQHVLLVDDVLTTGATIEACYQVLSETEDIKISVATLARAQM